MTASRILLLLLSLCSSGRACIPTVTPDYIYDLEYLEEQERLKTTSSVLLTTVMETTQASTSPASAAPTTTTTVTTSTTSTTTTSTTTTTTLFPCPTNPTPWYWDMATNVCYYVSTNTAEGPDAETQCANFGAPGNAHLASIGTQAENDLIFNSVIPAGGGFYWIGLKQDAGTTTLSGTGTWFDMMTVYDYPGGWTNWRGGSPPGVFGTNTCIGFNGHFGGASDGQWDYEPCTNTRPFICEVPASP